MNVDAVTLKDLGIYSENGSVFSLLNRTVTKEAELILKKWINTPPSEYEQLLMQQESIRFLYNQDYLWTNRISNGTIIMIQRFYESRDTAVSKPNSLWLWSAKLVKSLFKKNLMAVEQFSLEHFIDFFKGCEDLLKMKESNPPYLIYRILEELQNDLDAPLIKSILQLSKSKLQKDSAILTFKLKTEAKHKVSSMIIHFAKLDAYHSLAKASREHQWSFPHIFPSEDLCFQGQQFYHPILENPVKYDIEFNSQEYFLFLTGANMSGKSTLIRTIGLTALLAHLGCGVPAKSLNISFLKGIITNMQVEDNIYLGESYFFSEVQRMNITAKKLKNSKYYLVLMDELFKGTNVHDAYECSAAVIQGLLRKDKNLLALSTHLYELHHDLKDHKSIFFKYCKTNIDSSGNYQFTYELENGVSDDKIGYLILKKEGVLDLLH